MKTRTTLVIGSILAGTAVIMGAMGAHALKPLLSAEQLISYETGVRYQLYHALALLLLVALGEKIELKMRNYASRAFLLGTILFSGSIYLLSLHTLIGIENYKWLGPITPMGGLCFIIGWVCIVIAAIRSKNGS